VRSDSGPPCWTVDALERMRTCSDTGVALSDGLQVNTRPAGVTSCRLMERRTGYRLLQQQHGACRNDRSLHTSSSLLLSSFCRPHTSVTAGRLPCLDHLCCTPVLLPATPSGIEFLLRAWMLSGIDTDEPVLCYASSHWRKVPKVCVTSTVPPDLACCQAWAQIETLRTYHKLHLIPMRILASCLSAWKSRSRDE
jgi:hypothetical protein